MCGGQKWSMVWFRRCKKKRKREKERHRDKEERERKKRRESETEREREKENRKIGSKRETEEERQRVKLTSFYIRKTYKTEIKRKQNILLLPLLLIKIEKYPRGNIQVIRKMWNIKRGVKSPQETN